MKLLLYHFIHLYFISEFEVLFYIYYILPYETRMINNLFVINNLPYYLNSTSTTHIYNYYNCQNSLIAIEKFNEHLFVICYYYLLGINILFLFIIIYDIYSMHNEYKSILTKKYTSASSLIEYSNSELKNIELKNIELKNIDSNKNGIDKQISANLEEITQTTNNEKFICYYMKKSQIINEIKKLLQFLIFIGIFEYVFFIYIINKFKIANSKTILCNIIKEN